MTDLSQNLSLGGRFTWDERSRRYRNRRTGRFVTNVSGDLDALLLASEREMGQLAVRLREGGVSLDAWRSGMQNEIRQLHVASYSLARGGYAQMSQSDWGRVGQLVRRDYEFLERFAQQIASGNYPLDGRMLARVNQYIRAGRHTYWRVEREISREHGFDEENSDRFAGDSCEDCIEMEQLGWQPIGTLIPIGERICRFNCRCKMRFRNSATGEIRESI